MRESIRGIEVNLDSFAQQIQFMQRRLDTLYRGACTEVQAPPDLLPMAFKELGIVSEELEVAVEELQQQNAQLLVAQEAVERERQRYQELFEFAPDAYLVADAGGTIKEANRAAAKLLNVSPRFLAGKPIVVFVVEEERQNFHTQLTQLHALEQAHEWVLSLCPRHDQPFKASLTGTIVKDWQGNVVGIRLCIRNISDAGHRSFEGETAKEELEVDEYDPTKDYQKNIYLKGETISLKPQTICLVTRGIVKLSTISETGEEVLVGLAGPSMPFGTDLTGLKTYQAIAMCEVELGCFSFKDIAAHPHFAQKILPQISQRLKQTEALLAISGQRHVKDRLHYLLLLLKQEIGQPIEQGTRLSIRLTHQDLAAACSTTRVTITRMLGKLQAQGKIFIDSQNHIILKEPKFQETSSSLSRHY